MGAAEVRVLGRFAVLLPDGRPAGPWQRPIARRLVQALAVRDTHRMARGSIQELFFTALTPERSANALSKALTMVRRATAPFEVVGGDREMVWLESDVMVDADLVRSRLHHALALEPGDERDGLLVAALATGETLLEDEQYADWALQARDELDVLRAEARRTLARDRAAGHGRGDAAAVVAAWRDVFMHDPADEEACLGLVATEAAAGQWSHATRTYERTVEALADLGLEPSRQLERDVHRVLGTAFIQRGSSPPVKPTLSGAQATFEAARRARRQLADRAARSLFAEALEQVGTLTPPERARLRAATFDARVQLGELTRDIGELEAAQRHLQVGLRLAEGDAELARVWCAIGSVPYRVGDMQSAIVAYESGRAALRGDDPVAELRLTTDLAFALHRSGQGERALELLGSACAGLDEVDDLALVGWALDHLCVFLLGAGRHEESLAAIQQAFAVVGVLGDEDALVPLHIHRAVALGALERIGEGLADTAAALRIAGERDDKYARSVAHWVAADLRERNGDLTGALADRDAELELLERLGNQRNLAGCQAARAGLLVQLGRPDDAREAARCARQAAAGCDDEQLAAAIERELLPRTSPAG